MSEVALNRKKVVTFVRYHPFGQIPRLFQKEFVREQGHFTHTKTPPHRALQKAYAWAL